MPFLVSCPHCLDVFPTLGSPADAQVHCSLCGKAFFLVDDVCADRTVWFVLRGEKRFGPYTLTRLRELVEQHRVLPTDQLTRVGARKWVQAGSLQALFPQEDLTPPPRGRCTLGDSDEMIIFGPGAEPIQGPLSQDGLRVVPHRSLTLGDFQILRKLGAGGMGAVYLARQHSLGRHVALKILAKVLAGEQSHIDRFYREADILAGLVHPNIITFYGVGQERDFPYFAMEYVEGISTAAAMRRCGGRLPVADALHITLRCAHALRYAHANGVVHRDVKPENVMITRLGHVKIADLGLAKPVGDITTLTETGTVLGTPKYMAPEQARNAKRADRRSDLYALGGVLYYFLTGEVPFHAATAVELQAAKECGLYPAARSINAEVPTRLDLIIHKLLAFERERRYQHADELIRDLEHLGLAGDHLSFNPLQAFIPSCDESDPAGRIEILLIHDRTEDIIRAQEALEENGLPSNLNAVEDGREAMAYLRHEGKYAAAPQPALILLGRNLRAGGSLEMLAALRASDAWRSIPVVLLGDDGETAARLAANGLHVSLTVARPNGKRAFARLVRSLKDLCETVVQPPQALE